jgi:uncharacterized protein
LAEAEEVSMASKYLSWWMLPLLSVGSIGAKSSDFRLARAVRSQNSEAIHSLLNERVDVNVPEPDGTTALAWAAHWDDLNTADLLIRAGANANAANDNGVTPLWLACNSGSSAMVKELLAARADPNASHLPAGETALLRCSGTGSVDAVKLLLDRGADVNATEIAGQTPLMWAIEERHPEVARVLIEHGAGVNTASKNGFTPLLFAARQGDIDSGRVLLENGADISATARKDLNTLLVAIASGREQFAIFLVEHGANPNAADDRGTTALHYALQQGLSNLNGVAHDPQYAALDFLFRANMAELVKVLLDHGANPNARILKRTPPLRIGDRPKIDLIGATPFLLAAATGDVKVMKLLLAKGADPLLTTEDGTTPLMAAAGISKTEDRTKEEEKNALEALKLIVELGGDVNTANKNGLTSMHGAAYTGADEIVQFLADRGARLDVKDKFGETPLSIASGDPNGLADDFSRRVHRSTEALLRKLMNDNTSLRAVATQSDIPATNQAQR